MVIDIRRRVFVEFALDSSYVLGDHDAREQQGIRHESSEKDRVFLQPETLNNISTDLYR